MAYRVPKVNYGCGWKIKFESYKNGRVNKDVPKDQWRTLGFLPSMTWEEAKERARQLNAQKHLERHNERRENIAARIKEENVVHTAVLGETLVQEFEAEIVNGRTYNVNNKHASHWQAAKRVILVIKLDPTLWHKKPEKFYDYFSAQHWSPSYVQKVLKMLNRWGDFVTEKTGQRWRPIPPPKHQEKERIDRAYYEKRPYGMTSRAIEFSEIEAAKSKLKPEHYNWLCIAIWFGLRPHEIEIFKKPEGPWTWRVEDNVLWLFQPKLRGPREEKLKPIPLLRPEQWKALEFIRSGNIARPLTKTLKAYFGERTYLYCGRKAFVDLMQSFGHDLADISVWMGHRNVDRTWKNYKNKQKWSFKK